MNSIQDYGPQLEKGGMLSPGRKWDPSPSGGVQVSRGLVHEWGTNGVKSEIYVTTEQWSSKEKIHESTDFVNWEIINKQATF